MIDSGKVVNLSYCLRNDAGEVVDESGDESFAYLHGAGEIVPGLEAALEGLDVGAKKDVKVSAAEGYGEYQEGLKTAVDRALFPEGQPLSPGMQFAAEMDGGDSVVFTITQVEDDKVHVDGNHPLAGETLHFEVEVLAIRSATDEEKAHGHVHS